MFWILRPPNPPAVDGVYGSVSSDNGIPIWRTAKCQNCGRIHTNEQIRDLPIELFGSNLEAFVWVDDPAIIVRESLANALRRAGLTGFRSRPVNVTAWWRLDSSRQEIINWLEIEQPTKLYQILITGRGGSVLATTKMKIDTACASCGIKRYTPLQNGLIIDSEQWDRSDLFFVDEFPGHPIITDNFLKILLDEGAGNCQVVSADTFPIQESQ